MALISCCSPLQPSTHLATNRRAPSSPPLLPSRPLSQILPSSPSPPTHPLPQILPSSEIGAAMDDLLTIALDYGSHSLLQGYYWADVEYVLPPPTPPAAVAAPENNNSGAGWSNPEPRSLSPVSCTPTPKSRALSPEP